jgi:hypothetical protein
MLQAPPVFYLRAKLHELPPGQFRRRGLAVLTVVDGGRKVCGAADHGQVKISLAREATGQEMRYQGVKSSENQLTL